jgi:hypothetical protein
VTDETDVRAPTPPGRAPQTDLKERAREVGSEAQRRAGELREAARSTLHDAKAAAEERTEAAKGQAADEIARTARGLEAAADELAEAPLQQELLREAAGGLQQIAQAIQGKSLGALVEDLADFGRRNPVAYLGGAALAGFALARFARASAPSLTGEDEDFRGTSRTGSSYRGPYGAAGTTPVSGQGETSGLAEYAGASGYSGTTRSAGYAETTDADRSTGSSATGAQPTTSPQAASDLAGGGSATSPQSAADLAGEKRDG